MNQKEPAAVSSSSEITKLEPSNSVAESDYSSDADFGFREKDGEKPRERPKVKPIRFTVPQAAVSKAPPDQPTRATSATKESSRSSMFIQGRRGSTFMSGRKSLSLPTKLSWQGSNAKEGPSCRAEEMVREFPKGTSFHGLSRAWSTDRSGYLRSVWLGVTVLSMSVLLMCLYEIYVDYLTYPVRMMSMVSHESQLPFPAVTVCHLSELDPRKANNRLAIHNASGRLFNLYRTESVDPVRELRDYIVDKNYEPLLSLTKHHVYNVASPVLNEILTYCSYEGKPFDCSKEFIRDPYAPHCSQFNADTPQAVQVKDVGPGSGLRLIIRDDKTVHLVGAMLSDGVKVTLHRPGKANFADVAMKGMLVQPQTTTFMVLEYTEEQSLPYPYKSYGHGYCKDKPDAGYSRDLCVNECVWRRVSKMCHCSAAFTEKERNGSQYKDCKMGTYLLCFRPGLVTERRASNDKNSVCSKECPRRCDQAWYSVRTSQAKFPSHAATYHLDRSRFIKDTESYMEVIIFFEKMTKTKIFYKPHFTSDVLLGVLGGHMGFFLGASVLTLFEVGELLVYAGSWLVNYMRRVAEEADARSDYWAH